MAAQSKNEATSYSDYFFDVCLEARGWAIDKHAVEPFLSSCRATSPRAHFGPRVTPRKLMSFNSFTNFEAGISPRSNCR